MFTVKEFFAKYPDDDACLDTIMGAHVAGERRFCGKCGRDAKWYRVKERRAYACQFCGDHFYPCAGTVFQDSRTSLLSWFYAMYLFTTSRHGVPAKELQRQLGVTYKCAWRMGHQIRKLMSDEASGGGQLKGMVETDAAYVGGRVRRDPKHPEKFMQSKSILSGAVQRGGNIRVETVSDVRMDTLRRFVRKNVEPGAILNTDEHMSYGLAKGDGYLRKTVKHKAHQYVRGPFHVNTMEGFWSRLKASINGTHVHVSGRYLDNYAAEFSFRFNHRKEPGAMFSRLVSSLAVKE